MVFFTQSEWVALGLSLALLLAAGAWHLGGILTLKALIHRLDIRSAFSVLLAFWGIAILHFSEVMMAAIVFWVAINWFELGTVIGGYGDTPGGLLYLAGVTYATLGYTDQLVDGPLRLMTMMLSLAGFMLITWSATYVYSIWAERYRDSEGG